MKFRGVPYSEVRAKALQNPDIMGAYLPEKKEVELQTLLSDMRWHAGKNSMQVAESMRIRQPTVSKSEKNALRLVFQRLKGMLLAALR